MSRAAGSSAYKVLKTARKAAEANSKTHFVRSDALKAGSSITIIHCERLNTKDKAKAKAAEKLIDTASTALLPAPKTTLEKFAEANVVLSSSEYFLKGVGVLMTAAFKGPGSATAEILREFLKIKTPDELKL